jgi:ATP-binding cassette subfamily B protein/subfamily B ATP-binding cassette protein MsbA
LKFLRRVLTYIKPYKGLAALTLFAAVLSTIMDLVPPWLIKLTIDEGIRSGRALFIVALTGVMVAVYGIKALSNMARIRLNNTFEQKVIYDIRNHVYQATQRLSISYFENHSTGEIMSRINNDVENMERIFIDGIEHLIVAALTLVGIAAVLFTIQWKLALVAILPLPILAFSAVLFTKRIHRSYKSLRQRLADLNTLLQDTISGIRETMIFNRQEHEAKRFEARNKACCDGSLEVSRLWSYYSPAMAFLASMGSVLILGFGSYQVSIGAMTVGELVAFFAYAALFYAPINQIHAINHMLQHAIAAGERVFELIDTPPEVAEPESPIVLPGKLHGVVQFNDVSFHYVSNLPVLRQIDFEISPGETVALVGATGSGKTTIVSLLMRFYDVQGGNITIDGYDVRTMSLKTLREQIGLVRQEPFLFNGTVRENIAYGDLTASNDRVVAAARAACADDFVRQLPEGYETWIGERGVKLSIGQKQRLAIARAFLKNPPIIIFDEGTSSVDAETEGSIQEGLKNLFAHRTTLIVAHRLSSLRGSQRILVVDQGKIVETGTHESLIRQNGIYTALFEAQLQL